MKLRHWSIIAAAVMAMTQAAFSLEIIEKDNYAINMHGTLQTLGFSDYVLDKTNRDHLRLYLFLRQARLGFDGHVNSIHYDLLIAFGGEDGVKNTGGTVSNTAQGLLDYNADVPLFGTSLLKIGQFKVPYGLERLEDSGSLMFADRSIAQLPFNMGRDVGLAFHDNPLNCSYVLGLFTGGGRDNPIRDLPLRLGTPMLVFRGGWKEGIDEDLFKPKQVSEEGLKPGFAVFGNALFIRDSRVGHSTVLQVKSVEKNLLTDSNWNPFIGKIDPVLGGANYITGDLWQTGGDVLWRGNAGGGILSAEAEVNYGQYNNAAGILEATGARTQVGFSKDKWAVGFRYAMIFPDDKFANSANPARHITANKDPIIEITPSLTLFHKKYFKIVADAPILVNVPVSSEQNLGSYVLTDQTDQTNAGPIERQTIPSARLVLQLSF